MEDTERLLAGNREHRTRTIEQIERFTSGRWTTGEMVDGVRVDRTDAYVEDLRRQLAIADAVIAAYERDLANAS